MYSVFLSISITASVLNTFALQIISTLLLLCVEIATRCINLLLIHFMGASDVCLIKWCRRLMALYI